MSDGVWNTQGIGAPLKSEKHQACQVLDNGLWTSTTCPEGWEMAGANEYLSNE